MTGVQTCALPIFYGRPEEAYLLAAVVYFIMCFGLSYMVKKLQNKIAIIR